MEDSAEDAFDFVLGEHDGEAFGVFGPDGIELDFHYQDRFEQK
jgi:hypothetical protein